MLHLVRWRLLYCVAFLLCCSGRSGAEELQSDYIAQTWTSDDGLPASEVLALLQSSDGYLWIGTPGGLARFDGNRFVTSRKSEAPGLTSNRILSLCNDGEGGIWIGTDGGGLTHSVQGRLDLTPRVQGLSSMTILSVHVDRDKVLWAGSAAGLNRWEGNRFVPYLKVDGLPDETITAIADGPGEALFIGTGNGVGRYTGDSFTPLFSDKLPAFGKVSALAAEANERVWIGSETGLYSVTREAHETNCLRISGEAIVTLLQRTNGEIWFGTASGSLKFLCEGCAIPVEAWRFESPPKALLEDHESNVWAGTREGLTRLKKRQMRFIESATGGDVVSYYSSSNGTGARVLKDGTAHFFISGTKLDDRRFPANALVKAVDGFESTLWIGTSGEGLWRVDGQARRVWGQAEGLSDIFVEALHATGANSVWVGTRNGGLNHVTDSGIQRFLTPWGLSGNYASTIVSDAAGTIWVGTTGDGLFSLRNGVFKAYTTGSGLRDNRITALIAEKNGTLWVGTAAGLNVWDGTRLYAFSDKNGMPEEAIDQLQDSMNHLWLGSGQVLYRCEKAQLLAIAAGERRTAYPVPYGRTDGLAGASVVPDARMSHNSAKDRVVFSTNRGLLVVDPARIQLNTNPPPVIIQEVLIGSEAVPPLSNIEVPPGKQSIQFRYAALSFAAPEKVRFRCRLSGFDSDWIEVGASRTMRYAQVPPGTYRFKVVACNNDGLWNEDGVTLGLIVAPFWWQTNWFRVSVPLFGLGIATALVLFQRQRRHEIERLRVRIAGDLHDEIGSSLWSITLLSKMLQQGNTLGDEDKRDAGEIHRIASQTSNALRDIVWLINPGLDTLQDMVLRMRDFLSATVRGMQVQVNADQADLSRKLSLEMRQSFFLVFKEAVTNVAKHGRATSLEVILKETHGILEMRVKDDGVGFDAAQPSRGHGLQSLKRRAKAVRGEIAIDTARGKGTEVIMRASLGLV